MASAVSMWVVMTVMRNREEAGDHGELGGHVEAGPWGCEGPRGGGGP